MNESPIELMLIQENPEIKEHQLLLLHMGFDLAMINKAIKYSNYQTIEDLIDYLTKENGLWKHPFILKETPPPLTASRNFDNAIGLLNGIDSIAFFQKKVCDICGEEEQHHEQFQVDNPFDRMRSMTNSINSISNGRSSLKDNNDDPFCGICLCAIEDKISLSKCNHVFCSECFRQHVEELIKANRIAAIPCPEANCDNVALEEEFFLPLLSHKAALKYNEFKAHNEIAKDHTKVFCPLCESYAVLPQGNIRNSGMFMSTEQPKVELTCVKNKHRFCSCGRTLHEGKCYKEGKELMEYMKSENIRKCPRCGFLIKKTMGCNHMICGNPNCNYEFCWVCMKECLPNHYDQGLCAGLQFIDEDSWAYKAMSFHPCVRCGYSVVRTILLVLCYAIFILFAPVVFGLDYCFRSSVPRLMYTLNSDTAFSCARTAHRFHVLVESIFVLPICMVGSAVGMAVGAVGMVIWGVILLCRCCCEKLSRKAPETKLI